MVSRHAQEVVEVARGPDDTKAPVWMQGRVLVVWGLNDTMSRLGAREEEGLVVAREGGGERGAQQAVQVVPGLAFAHEGGGQGGSSGSGGGDGPYDCPARVWMRGVVNIIPNKREVIKS